jgi:hypothetical protein
VWHTNRVLGKNFKSGPYDPSGGQDLKIQSQPDTATWQEEMKVKEEDFIFFLVTTEILRGGGVAGGPNGPRFL